MNITHFISLDIPHFILRRYFLKTLPTLSVMDSPHFILHNHSSLYPPQILPNYSLTAVPHFILHNHPHLFPAWKKSHFILRVVAIGDLTSKDNITSHATHKLFKLQMTLLTVSRPGKAKAALQTQYLLID